MTHPHKASAIIHDVAWRLEKIGVEDITNIRLWEGMGGPDENATMTVRLELRTPADVDKVAGEFGLPAAATKCASCGSSDHSCTYKYLRHLDLTRNGQFVLAADEDSIYVVVEASSPKVTSPVGAA